MFFSPSSRATLPAAQKVFPTENYHPSPPIKCPPRLKLQSFIVKRITPARNLPPLPVKQNVYFMISSLLVQKIFPIRNYRPFPSRKYFSSEIVLARSDSRPKQLSPENVLARKDYRPKLYYRPKLLSTEIIIDRNYYRPKLPSLPVKKVCLTRNYPIPSRQETMCHPKLQSLPVDMYSFFRLIPHRQSSRYSSGTKSNNDC